jgi:hypothetical protein
MNWPYLTREDVPRIVLLIVILGGLLFVAAIYRDLVRKTNYGFGPEWECSSPTYGNGDRVCIKRPMKSDKSN